MLERLLDGAVVVATDALSRMSSLCGADAMGARRSYGAMLRDIAEVRRAIMASTPARPRRRVVCDEAAVVGEARFEELGARGGSRSPAAAIAGGALAGRHWPATATVPARVTATASTVTPQVRVSVSEPFTVSA